jgi:hypothetical protein
VRRSGGRWSGDLHLEVRFRLSGFGQQKEIEKGRVRVRGKKGEMASEGNFGGEGVIKRTSEQVGRAD